MFILDTNKLGGDQTVVSNQLHTILEKNNAEVLASRPWMTQDLKLHYPIKNAKKGLYYLAYFRTEGKNLAAIEHDFALNETILRNMILKIDPKMVETMLTLARDERALALQTVNTPPDDELGSNESEERGRRGPRRPPMGGRGDKGE
jgi:small subunit ribosomal protein S6